MSVDFVLNSNRLAIDCKSFLGVGIEVLASVATSIQRGANLQPACLGRLLAQVTSPQQITTSFPAVQADQQQVPVGDNASRYMELCVSERVRELEARTTGNACYPPFEARPKFTSTSDQQPSQILRLVRNGRPSGHQHTSGDGGDAKLHRGDGSALDSGPGNSDTTTLRHLADGQRAAIEFNEANPASSPRGAARRGPGPLPELGDSFHVHVWAAGSAVAGNGVARDGAPRHSTKEVRALMKAASNAAKSDQEVAKTGDQRFLKFMSPAWQSSSLCMSCAPNPTHSCNASLDEDTDDGGAEREGAPIKPRVSKLDLRSIIDKRAIMHPVIESGMGNHLPPISENEPCYQELAEMLCSPPRQTTPKVPNKVRPFGSAPTSPQSIAFPCRCRQPTSLVSSAHVENNLLLVVICVAFGKCPVSLKLWLFQVHDHSMSRGQHLKMMRQLASDAYHGNIGSNEIFKVFGMKTMMKTLEHGMYEEAAAVAVTVGSLCAQDGLSNTFVGHGILHELLDLMARSRSEFTGKTPRHFIPILHLQTGGFSRTGGSSRTICCPSQDTAP